MKKVIFSAAALLLATACSVDSGSMPAVNNTISVTASLGTTTRISVAEDAQSNSWILSWAENDALGGFAMGGSESSFALYEMDSYDPNSSTFKGEASDLPLRFVYPYSAEALIADGLYEVDLSSQRFDILSPMANMSSTHLISAHGFEPSESSSISMQHIGCAITLNLSIESLYLNGESYTYRLSRIEMGTDDDEDGNYLAIPTSCEIDLNSTLDQDSFYSNISGGVIAVDVDNSPQITPGEVYSVIFSALPISIASAEQICLKCYFDCYNLDGEFERVCYTKGLTVTNDSDSTVEFARATHNTISASYAGSLYYGVSITAGLN
ncbi:MAG: hypothetical protein SNI45_03660 [Rikenellaceae bacterium]